MYRSIPGKHISTGLCILCFRRGDVEADFVAVGNC